LKSCARLFEAIRGARKGRGEGAEGKMIGAIVLFFGAGFRKLLNVCIHRFPLEESIVSPARIARIAKARSAGMTIFRGELLVLRAGAGMQGRDRRALFYDRILSGLIWLAFWAQYGARVGPHGHPVFLDPHRSFPRPILRRA